jgi:hypothetical protein
MPSIRVIFPDPRRLGRSGLPYTSRKLACVR